MNVVNLSEDIAILVWIATMILAFLHPFLNVIAAFLELSLLGWFVFGKIPLKLNSALNTNQFTADLSLRIGLWLSSFGLFSAFFAFTLCNNDWYFPAISQALPPFSIEMPVVLLLASIIFCISIPYFSWRLCKYPNLTRQSILKLYRSKEEFQEDFEQIKIFGLIKKHVAPGIFLAGISVILTLGLFLLSVMDIIFLAFLFAWLIFNLGDIKGAYTLWKQLDGILIWKGLALEGIRMNVEILGEILLLFFGLIVISLFALPSLIDFVGMVILGYWYILIILFQIVMRLRFRLRLSNINYVMISLPTLPPHADFLTGFYMSVMTVLLLSFYLELYWLFFIVFFLFIPANIAGLKSILSWKKRKDEMKSQLSQKGMQIAQTTLQSDRYRSMLIVFGISTPIVLVTAGVKGSICWAALLGTVVTIMFFDAFCLKIDKVNAMLNASLKACYVGIAFALLLLLARFTLPEHISFINVFAVVYVLALVICWAITFRERTYKARRTKESEEKDKEPSIRQEKARSQET